MSYLNLGICLRINRLLLSINSGIRKSVYYINIINISVKLVLDKKKLKTLRENCVTHRHKISYNLSNFKLKRH